MNGKLKWDQSVPRPLPYSDEEQAQFIVELKEAYDELEAGGGKSIEDVVRELEHKFPFLRDAET
jgi:hypothetical protein